jgi:hypothetical protein
MDDPRFVFWHSFEPGVASFGLAGVITEIGPAVFGADFAALQPDDRRRRFRTCWQSTGCC